MSVDNIHIITNAADVIDMFDRAGKRYPHPGKEVARDDILEVIEYLRQERTQRLFGWCGIHDDITLRVDEISLAEKRLTLTDLGDTSLSGEYIIAEEPHPKAAEFHGDLLYDLRRFDPVDTSV